MVSKGTEGGLLTSRSPWKHGYTLLFSWPPLPPPLCATFPKELLAMVWPGSWPLHIHPHTDTKTNGLSSPLKWHPQSRGSWVTEEKDGPLSEWFSAAMAHALNWVGEISVDQAALKLQNTEVARILKKLRITWDALLRSAPRHPGGWILIQLSSPFF